MKRRITFIHEPDDQFDPKQLDFQKDSLQVKSLKAAREERWTTTLSELPQEVRLSLKQLHELRIRWASSKPYDATAPFASSIPPGLHVLLTPQKERSATLICPLLIKIFGGSLNCTLPEDVFTHIPITAERFASSPSLQYYEMSTVDDLSNHIVHNLVEYLVEKICLKGKDVTCHDHIEKLKDAKYVDIDYNTISQTVSLTAFFQLGSGLERWDERIDSPKASTQIEVGILAVEKSSTLQEISLGGYLATLGEDTKAKPTLFSFPSRHHLSQSNYITYFTSPTGLHPTLRLQFPDHVHPPAQSCALHTYINLPSSLFPDKYQLSQSNLLKSHNIATLRSLSPSAPDLEAPVWAVPEWGSTVLLELSPPPPTPSTTTTHTHTHKPNSADNNQGWHASIPLHLRYLPPSANHTHTALTLPNPIVFWACPSSHTDGPELDTNPFDRTNLGYDGLFGSRTLFFHLRDVSALTADGGGGGARGEELELGAQQQLLQRRGNVQVVNVPVLDVREARWVEVGTGLVVAVGCGWVVWCLWVVVMGPVRVRGGGGGRKKGD